MGRPVRRAAPSIPTPGQLSSIYARSDVLEQRQTQTVYFSVVQPPGQTWVDVIMDTTLETTELDESNNVASAYLNFPDCS